MRYLLLTCMLLALAPASFAQQSRGARLYQKHAYAEAIPYLLKELNRNPDLQTMEQLADCYWQSGNRKEAGVWYSKLSNGSAAKAGAVFRYGQCLMAEGKYDEAKTAFVKYANLAGNESGVDLAIASEEAKELRKDSSGYKITKLPFNSEGSDFCAVPYKTGYVFASDRPRGRFFGSRNAASGKACYDLYYSSPNTQKKPGKAAYMQGRINSPYHDGPVSFSLSGQFAFVSRSGMQKGRLMRDSAQVNRLGIFSLMREGEKWLKPVPLPFNHPDYSVTHGWLTRDERRLFFASDMPGGFGGFDLYMAERDSSGNWGKPLNLGPRVNTSWNELYPTTGDKGKLYFSSTGHKGFGGLDIYSAEYENGEWRNVSNMGFPLNSGYDDFALVWMDGKPEGMFSSDRPGGAGGDDIWKVQRNPALRIRIIAGPDSLPLANATVEVMNVNGQKVKLKTSEEGLCQYFVSARKDLFLEISAANHVSKKVTLAADKLPLLDDKEALFWLAEDRAFVFKGEVKDKADGKPLPDAEVTLITGSRYTVKAENGRFEFPLGLDKEYTAIVSREGYMPRIYDFNTRVAMGPETLDVSAELEKRPYIFIEGRVLSHETGRPLSGVSLHFVDENTRDEISSAYTRSDGMYHAVVVPVSSYSLIASAPGYFSNRIDISPQDTSKTELLSAQIELIKMDTGKVVKILYFAYNKSDLNIFSKRDLDEIVYFLRYNLQASVELSAHTDCRGSHAYNQKLSEFRAESAVGYIRNKKIEKERIIAAGYGETRLVNTCADGVNCSEEEHAKNRRAELKVIEINPQIKGLTWR